MGYLYVYQIKTPSGTVVKVGHGETEPKSRMQDYAKTYDLDIDTSSLKYRQVSNSKEAERFVHDKLIKLGYRNIRDGMYGPQEMFQSPHGTEYKDVVKMILKLTKEWELEYADIQYKASDLVGGNYLTHGTDREYKKSIWLWIGLLFEKILKVIFASTLSFVVSLFIFLFIVFGVVLKDEIIGGKFLGLLVIFGSYALFKKLFK